jgi:CRISPR-associated endonuclease/helicase Cas3
MSELSDRYEDFFRTVFKGKNGESQEPFYYQRKLATESPIPGLLNIPTGAGKTNAILGAWMWRRLKNTESVGRRLVYCLPMRTLVEQTRDVAKAAIANIEREWPALKDRFQIHVVMGGDVTDEWDSWPERECILIGTQDMLLSRALNRGYALSRFRWPVQFGLLNSDCLWVFDEVQLMGNGLATSTQLAAFREQFKTFGPCHSIWMSATLDTEWLKTVDFGACVNGLIQFELSDADKSSETLNRRLKAIKIVQSAPKECRSPKGLAKYIKESHKPGTQTLIVVNRVARAKETFAALEKYYAHQATELLLIHSRFRPNERKEWAEKLNAKPGPNGRIIVATQVVEAGVDISSSFLITDLAPWSSLVQRFGRCNRAGDGEARICWIDLPLDEKDDKLSQKDELESKDYERIARPYEWGFLKTARSLLEELQSASPADLEQIKHHDPFEPAHVLRRRDLVDLFDTTSDLSGYDLDVSRFVRGGDERDVTIFWRDLNGSHPSPDTPRPVRNELCPVSIGELKDFLKGKDISGNPRKAWVWNALDGKWQKINEDEMCPGLTLLLDVKAGGYDPSRGWDMNFKHPVPVVEARSEPEEAMKDDPLSRREYVQTLKAHSCEARLAAGAIIDSLKNLSLDEWRAELITATHHHDWGKAHPVFQETLYKGLDGIDAGVMLAKSTSNARHSRARFRHELASALALLETGATDLVVYLAACHHGKVRLSIRALPGEEKPQEPDRKFARGIHDGETLPGVDLGEIKPKVELDLEPMLLGASADGSPSWLERMIALRDHVGVFRLAYLECLIRAADVRASSNPKEVL